MKCGFLVPRPAQMFLPCSSALELQIPSMFLWQRYRLAAFQELGGDHIKADYLS